MPHTQTQPLDHTLIVLRELRRRKSELKNPGMEFSPCDLVGLQWLNVAIHATEMAQKEFAANGHETDLFSESLITEAIRHMDLRK